MSQKTELATFAGGCFWCMQGPFDATEGVISTRVGYTGGTKENPTYEDVSSGRTGHAEAIEIEFDPEKVSYEELLEIFWRNIDPTTKNQQFSDKGTQYRTAIFYHDEKQKELAEKSKMELEKSEMFDKPIVTEIVPASRFYPAEEYHQEFYQKNPQHYQAYKTGSGRSAFIERMWKQKFGRKQ
ncbi:MAG: peptide-methionine (S)-S-oxide reductase MsrA [Fibrobacter sp.]|jgi:peptide methionine sulfoxide reductase msrA/msrB|nr:peptide-methionine (S)-S-oxide reductase MsrA [Fibrobacter sp.]